MEPISVTVDGKRIYEVFGVRVVVSSDKSLIFAQNLGTGKIVPFDDWHTKEVGDCKEPDCDGH